MAEHRPTGPGVLILAGIGAGALVGVALGLALGRHAGRQEDDDLTGTVDELKEHAQQVLGELSENVSHLVERSRGLLDEARQRDTKNHPSS